MTRFLVTTTFEDAAAMAVLMEGLRAHAEADAFPLWVENESIPPLLYKMLPYLRSLDDSWVLTLDDAASLETFVTLAATVPWKGAVHIAADDALKFWNLDQFHKAVMVDGEFAE